MEESREIVAPPSMFNGRTRNTAISEICNTIVETLDVFLDNINPWTTGFTGNVDESTRLMCYDISRHIMNELRNGSFDDHEMVDDVRKLFQRMLMVCFPKKGENKVLREIFPFELVNEIDTLFQLAIVESKYPGGL
jgi:hypothetical protein